MRLNRLHVAALILAISSTGAGAGDISLNKNRDIFDEDNFSRRVGLASTIVLCSDLPNVTPKIITNFASKIYPDHHPTVVSGGEYETKSGLTVYAYLGGKIPSSYLRHCAEVFYRSVNDAKIESAVIEAHTKLGGDLTNNLLPKNHPLKDRLSGSQISTIKVYNKDWIFMAFTSSRDELFARRQFLKTLFGLQYDFCERKCEELLKDQ